MTERQGLEAILGAAPVVPVLIVDDRSSVVPLARALVAGGLTAIEITLRTPAALEAIRAVAAEVDGAHVGAGTVLTAAQLDAAAKAGARFAVSPGSSPALLDAAEDGPIPLLPGASTATEAMTLLERGYSLQKFFPAGSSGGTAWIKSMASPLPGVRFCPTGGVDASNAATYLELQNVICVGGSWIAPKDAVAEQNWARIEELARHAANLRQGR